MNKYVLSVDQYMGNDMYVYFKLKSKYERWLFASHHLTNKNDHHWSAKSANMYYIILWQIIDEHQI